jgi:hypothetical protein
LIEEGQRPGVYCFEEPENGINPARIRTMLGLLQDIAADPTEPADDDNPLRQMIVNSHSPAVVAEVQDGDLVVAEPRKVSAQPFGVDESFPAVTFGALPKTWRTESGRMPEVARGKLTAYLNPLAEAEPKGESASAKNKPQRVRDRKDLGALLPWPAEWTDKHATAEVEA